MQNVGNTMREVIGPNVWIRPLLAGWYESGMAPTVVSDVRYPNEADAIRAVGGLIIRIERPGYAGLTGDAASHASEVPLPDHLVDFVVVNRHSIDALRDVAEMIANGG